MPLYALDDTAPVLEEDTWVAPDANLIGSIVIEQAASVWFGCTLRGDNEEIRVGAGSNVQESTVMHTDIGFPLTIGAGCTIGHKAMLHGCTIGDNSLVGMGATEVANVFIATGGYRNGVLLAPAIGEALAGAVLDGALPDWSATLRPLAPGGDNG